MSEPALSQSVCGVDAVLSADPELTQCKCLHSAHCFGSGCTITEEVGSWTAFTCFNCICAVFPDVISLDNMPEFPALEGDFNRVPDELIATRPVYRNESTRTHIWFYDIYGYWIISSETSNDVYGSGLSFCGRSPAEDIKVWHTGGDVRITGIFYPHFSQATVHRAN